VIGGNRVPDGAEPVATVYAGHQFGVWVPQLGDGRAILLGEVTGIDGERYDIQLKGSGPTPYSRGGDGRAPLGPVLREYIVSEAMAALGVPTTRSLAAVSTGEHVFRDSALPGAVLARVARSHIRVGTFQFFAARRDIEALRLLADHVIDRHYPKAREAENPVAAMLSSAVLGQARLVAHWQSLGFIHGVMNTDNMLLSGETIDYGPCAFMDSFDPAKVFSSIDRHGRYAYGNQPGVAHWNLACLAQALLPILSVDEDEALGLAQEALDEFPGLFERAYRERMAAKLGLAACGESDAQLLADFLSLMAETSSDFTLCFRRLYELAQPDETEAAAGELYEFPAPFADWLERWRQRVGADPQSPPERQAAMSLANPLYMPRNHRVEEAIADALTGDFAAFDSLVDVLACPHEHQPGRERFARPPRAGEEVRTTYCGT
jgi:uncharacterized protein YdiU (UPF0061 family)